MTRQLNSKQNYYYWRGNKRQTTRSILPDFVEELTPEICDGGLATKLGAVAHFGRRDVVVIDSWGKDALLLSLVKAAFGFRLVVRLRGDPIATIRRKGKLSNALVALATRFILSRADMLVFNSRHLWSHPDYRRYSAKADVVYNPLMYDHSAAPAETEAPSPGGLRILSAMNFGYMEKIRPLGEAITRWVNTDFMMENDITWTICGGYSDTDSYRWFIARVAEVENGDRIKFIGYQENMPALYASHDVLAHLSGLEAFPNTVLEASYFGLPTITIPQSGGTLEAVEDGVNGRIIADGPAFREALLRYARDPARRHRHGANARANVIKKFSIESQKAAMTTMLRKRFG